LSIPDDLTLVGFTNEPVAAIGEPPLTTVAQPVFQIGQTAAELLLHEIHADGVRQPVTKVLPTHLVVRNSSTKKVMIQGWGGGPGLSAGRMDGKGEHAAKSAGYPGKEDALAGE
jgi:hypothetical protein